MERKPQYRLQHYTFHLYSQISSWVIETTSSSSPAPPSAALIGNPNLLGFLAILGTASGPLIRRRSNCQQKLSSDLQLEQAEKIIGDILKRGIVVRPMKRVEYCEKLTINCTRFKHDYSVLAHGISDYNKEQE